MQSGTLEVIFAIFPTKLMLVFMDSPFFSELCYSRQSGAKPEKER